MSVERRNKLEAIDFRFGIKKNVIEWEKWYTLAKKYYEQHGNSEIPHNFKTKNGYEYDEEGRCLGVWCNTQRIRQDKMSAERRKKLELIGFRFIKKEEVEDKKRELCNQYGIDYDNYKILNRMSYQELYAKLDFLKDNNYPLEANEDLHEIFYISNENMILKYIISKEELITQYYINRKGRGV